MNLMAEACKDSTFHFCQLWAVNSMSHRVTGVSVTIDLQSKVNRWYFEWTVKKVEGRCPLVWKSQGSWPLTSRFHSPCTELVRELKMRLTANFILILHAKIQAIMLKLYIIVSWIREWDKQLKGSEMGSLFVFVCPRLRWNEIVTCKYNQE